MVVNKRIRLLDVWLVRLVSRGPFHKERRSLQSKTSGQQDKPEDTGIWSTFASKQDEHVTDQRNAKEMPRSTPKEPTALIGSKVSPFPIVLSEEPSFDSKEVDILPSDTNIVEHGTEDDTGKLDPGPSCPRADKINVN